MLIVVSYLKSWNFTSNVLFRCRRLTSRRTISATTMTAKVSSQFQSGWGSLQCWQCWPLCCWALQCCWALIRWIAMTTRREKLSPSLQPTKWESVLNVFVNCHVGLHSSLLHLLLPLLNPLMPTVAIWVQLKYTVPDWVKPSFVIFDIQYSDAQPWGSECPDVKNYKWRLNPVWHRMFYSCTYMATVGVKGK